MISYPGLLCLFVSCAAAQSLTTVLAQQSGLTKFTSYINQYPDLLTQLNGGNYTVLVPTDDAVTAFLDANGNDTNSADLEALLQYHCLQGLHPIVTFDENPQFLPSLLKSSNYSNVTGGQVVEAVAENGVVSIFTAVKAKSKITAPDNIYTGGLFQVIDSVLSIPLPATATITKAGLSDLIGLLNLAGFLTDPTVAAIIENAKDLTMLGPNSPDYSSTYTGWKGLDRADLLRIFKYGLVMDKVVYSSLFTNGTKYVTAEGSDVTITVTNNGTYFNAAKVITRDYITSNGVLQVLDSLLNPNQTNARPVASSAPITSRTSTGLSTGAKAGIAVGVIVLVLAVAALIFFFCRHRKKKSKSQERPILPHVEQERVPGPVESRSVEDAFIADFTSRKRAPSPERRRPETARKGQGNVKEIEMGASELEGNSSPLSPPLSPPPHYRTQSGFDRDALELDGREKAYDKAEME